MGQAMTSETLSISGNDGHRYWVGLQAKPSSRGWKKTVYKGVLLGCGPRQWEKVVAKSFSSIPGTKESWSHEVKKADVTKQLAVEFAEACLSDFKIRVVIPGLVQMDKVSKVNKWLEHRHGHRSLDKDDWISIEEHIPGHVYRFCPWREAHDSDDDEVMTSDHMQTFSHFTYKQTNGDMVACDFQGISEDETYIFTDSIIHSRLQSYGPFDAGDFGMTEFFKRHRCTRLCKDWPKPTPLTPPPSFDDDDDDDRHTGTRHVRFDLTRFENVVFPSQRLKVKGKRKGARSPGSRRRHASDHDTTKRREERGWHALTNEEQEQCRRFAYPSLSVPEDNPPAYSEFDNTSSSRVLGSANTLVSSVSLDEITGNSSSFKHFANYENTGPCASVCSTRRSCLKKNYSEQHNDVHTTKGFTLPPAKESCNNAGLREKKSLVSMGESQSDSSKVTFELGVPVHQWHTHKTTTSSANKNHSTSGKSVPSREKIEEESELLEDSKTLDSKSSAYSGTSTVRHIHQHDNSRPPTSLIERRISKEKGNNSKPDLSFTTMDELKLNLPPLQPSAPRLSDS